MAFAEMVPETKLVHESGDVFTIQDYDMITIGTALEKIEIPVLNLKSKETLILKGFSLPASQGSLSFLGHSTKSGFLILDIQLKGNGNTILVFASTEFQNPSGNLRILP